MSSQRLAIPSQETSTFSSLHSSMDERQVVVVVMVVAMSAVVDVGGAGCSNCRE